MVTVEFMGPLQRKDQVFDVSNLFELSMKLKEDESVVEWLKVCAIALNGNIVKDKNMTLKDNDKITLLPPVCGG